MKYKLLGLVFLSFLFSSCLRDADFTGLIRSKYTVKERFKQSMQWNKTHPFKTVEVSEENYKLLITADIHIGNAKTFNNYLKFVDRGLENDIAAMVFCGDLTSGREKDIEEFSQHLPTYTEKPSFVMVGNHELYFGGWETFHRIFGTTTYYFTIKTPTKEDLYLCLDSGAGTLGKDQLAWLRTILTTERGKYDKCVIFTHSNFFRKHHTASTSVLIDELLVLMDMFEENKVNMVIAGHDHRRVEHQWGGAKYIVLDALRDDDKNATYLVLQKTNLGFNYTFKKP